MMEKDSIRISRPARRDGAAIANLVRASQALDVNSDYLYFLLADHYAATCAIAYVGEAAAGFVTAYRLPEEPACLFVWQVGVDPAYRGRQIAMSLLLDLTQRDWFSQIKEIRCTISPSNVASRGLFCKLAERLHGAMREAPYLTEAEFGAGHEAEPMISIMLRS